MAPNRTRRIFVATNLGLADILSRMVFHLIIECFQCFWIPGFPDFQIRDCQLTYLVANWPEEPSDPENVDFLS